MSFNPDAGTRSTVRSSNEEPLNGMPVIVPVSKRFANRLCNSSMVTQVCLINSISVPSGYD